MENLTKTRAQRDNTYPLFGEGELAELICHYPMKILEIDMAVATHYYNIEYIGQILNQVELLADVDRLIGMIQTQWELDVCDCRQQVVKYDPDAEDYVAIVEDLPEKLAKNRQKIEKRLQLKALKAKQLEEWKVAHTSTATQTQSEPVDVKNQTVAPQFAEGNLTPPEDVEYHLEALPYDVREIFCFNDDVNYTLFVRGMHKVKEWVKEHRKQDWNVVRFVCIVRCVLAKRKTTLKLFAKLLQQIFSDIGDQENNMKHRKDANEEDNYLRYDDPQKSKWASCKQLKEDGSEVEDYFAPLIERLKGAA